MPREIHSTVRLHRTEKRARSSFGPGSEADLAKAASKAELERLEELGAVTGFLSGGRKAKGSASGDDGDAGEKDQD